MIRKGVVLTILSGLIFLVACTDPAADKSKAVTNAPAQVSPQTVAGDKYAINAQNSKIEFVGSKVTGSHHGSFGSFTGQVDYTGDPLKSRVNIAIDMSTLSADDPKLTEHLKTPDFFDVAKFPKAEFVSTEIKAGGEKGATHTVTGNLTMHGVTKSISFPATIAVSPDAAIVDSTFSINRKDFGINYAGAADNLIRDEVVLTLKIHATKS